MESKAHLRYLRIAPRKVGQVAALVRGKQVGAALNILKFTRKHAAKPLYKLIKSGTVRPRPYEAQPGIMLFAAPLDHFSFPSGHTLHAVAFTLVALAYYPWLAWFAVPFTLLVAASRVMLGLHYPSDVLAGVAIGATVAGASFLI